MYVTKMGNTELKNRTAAAAFAWDKNANIEKYNKKNDIFKIKKTLRRASFNQ